MQNIRKYLKENILIADGAMGTYYSQVKKGFAKMCEYAVLTEPETILEIHKAYIEAGAKLIRTDTFAANSMHFEPSDVRNIICRAVDIARKAAYEKDVYIGASIGPNFSARDTLLEYENSVDIFLELGIEIFVLETQADLVSVKKIAEYIKSKNKNAFVIAQFALSDDGTTRFAVSAEKITKNTEDNENIDMLGFNCGVGPLHMLKILERLNIKKAFSVLPNAGYPDMHGGKPHYPVSSEYFADISKEFVNLGAKMIGGCCGTTPEHIKKLSLSTSDLNLKKIVKSPTKHIYSAKSSSSENKFNKKLDSGKFAVAVEMMSPFGTDTEKLIDGAKMLSENGADIITVADCPMGKARAESTMIASFISQKTAALTMPHLCCRDRNTTALRASILAAYISGIRNILAVTGDPAVGDVKPVFNLSSYSLIRMINEMNSNEFSEDKIYIGAAVNFNAANKDAEYKRLLKKHENGAYYFLTQPIFTSDTAEFIKNIPKNRTFRILGGIMPPVSYKNVLFINNEMPGIDIPKQYAELFNPDDDRETAEKKGIEVAVDIAKKIKPYVDGFYLNTPFNRFHIIAEIMKKIL